MSRSQKNGPAPLTRKRPRFDQVEVNHKSAPLCCRSVHMIGKTFGPAPLPLSAPAPCSNSPPRSSLMRRTNLIYIHPFEVLEKYSIHSSHVFPYLNGDEGVRGHPCHHQGPQDRHCIRAWKLYLPIQGVCGRGTYVEKDRVV